MLLMLTLSDRIRNTRTPPNSRDMGHQYEDSFSAHIGGVVRGGALFMHLGASSTQVIFQWQLSVTFKLHRAACLVTVASGSCPLPSPRAGTY